MSVTGSLSVSDVRRARRDTGLSLEEVSKRSRIPVSMLRQLEWGYLRTGLYGAVRSHAAGEIRACRRPRPSTRLRRCCRSSGGHPRGRRPPIRHRTTTATGRHHSCCPAAADDRHRRGRRARRPGRRGSARRPGGSARRPVVRGERAAEVSEPASSPRTQSAARGTHFRRPVGNRGSGHVLMPSITAGELPRFRRHDRRAPPLVDGCGCRRADAGDGSRGMGRALAVDDQRPGLRKSFGGCRREQLVARATPAAAPAVNEPLRPSALGHSSVLAVARPVSTSGAAPATHVRLIPVDAIDSSGRRHRPHWHPPAASCSPIRCNRP